MKIPLQVTFRNMEPSSIVEEWIPAEAEKLDTFYNQIMACRVAVEIPHRHRTKGILYHIRIDLTVPGDRIKTGVHDGYVTLEGTVDWNFQRNGAEACARNVHGIRGVLNHIAVKPKVSAVEITHQIEEALRRSAEVDARRITVTARDGEVQLNGRVRSWFEREEAERAAWAAPGVSEVIDHIAVVP